MAIKRKKKHGRIYREEYKSIRVDGKVKSIYVRSLGPENPVDKVPKPKPKVLDRLEHGSSHRAGDAALLWELARELDFVNTIDRICCEGEVEGISPGKLLTAWAINRAIDPICATELENWIPITDLPRLMGLNPTDFTKEAFLTALDFVCYEDRGSGRFIDFTKQIDEALYRRWRKRHPLHPGEKETIAYDLTSVLFFGGDPLAELGYNPKGKCRQVNLALIVSRQDKCPVTHFVYNGGRNSSSTVKNLLTRLMDTSIEPGTVIWDRGNVSKTHVENVESAGWKLICGLPKTSREVRNIIDKTDIPLDPNTFIHKSRSGHIYADKTRGQLFGRERSVVVYVNQNQRIGEINAQNEALAEIGKKLDALNVRKGKWSEAELHKEINSIVDSWGKYIYTRVKRGEGPSIEWKYKTREMAGAERSCGKYVLLSTDELSAQEVVRSYFEKDYIEKVFRILKTSEEMEPVRHRLERRVRAYMFVCVLAYRLLADLQYRLKMISNQEDTWESADVFLRGLGMVERVQVRLGHQVKTWYLNLTKKNKETLRKMGLQNLLKESVDVDFKL